MGGICIANDKSLALSHGFRPTPRISCVDATGCVRWHGSLPCRPISKYHVPATAVGRLVGYRCTAAAGRGPHGPAVAGHPVGAAMNRTDTCQAGTDAGAHALAHGAADHASGEPGHAATSLGSNAAASSLGWDGSALGPQRRTTVWRWPPIPVRVLSDPGPSVVPVGAATGEGPSDVRSDIASDSGFPIPPSLRSWSLGWARGTFDTGQVLHHRSPSQLFPGGVVR